MTSATLIPGSANHLAGGTDRVLNTFPEELSLKAENALFKRGIEVRKKTF